MVRDKDLSGISGTGHVADGVRFGDGRVALRWVAGDTPKQTAVWDDITHVEVVHGHGGATRVEWID